MDEVHLSLYVIGQGLKLVIVRMHAGPVRSRLAVLDDYVSTLVEVHYLIRVELGVTGYVQLFALFFS